MLGPGSGSGLGLNPSLVVGPVNGERTKLGWLHAQMSPLYVQEPVVVGFGTGPGNGPEPGHGPESGSGPEIAAGPGPGILAKTPSRVRFERRNLAETWFSR